MVGGPKDPSKPDPREKMPCPDCGMVLSRHSIMYKHRCKAKQDPTGQVKAEPDTNKVEQIHYTAASSSQPPIQHTEPYQPTPMDFTRMVVEHLKNEKLAKANRKIATYKSFPIF